MVAVLSVVGGVDNTFYLGGPVEHSEYGRGTIANVSTSGKITVQFENILEMKTCRISDLHQVIFTLSTFHL